MFTLDISDANSKWERLNASLPVPMSNVGLWQPELDKMMIFGGWNV